MVEVRGSNGAFYKVTGYRTGPVVGLLPSLVSREAGRPRGRGGLGIVRGAADSRPGASLNAPTLA